MPSWQYLILLQLDFCVLKWQLLSEMNVLLLKLLIHEYVIWYINASLCILM